MKLRLSNMGDSPVDGHFEFQLQCSFVNDSLLYFDELCLREQLNGTLKSLELEDEHQFTE